METSAVQTHAPVITPDQVLAHWQGHRRVTRRLIEAFPEDALFNFSVGGMRPFAELTAEMLGIAVPSLEGFVTRQWNAFTDHAPATTKAELLGQWDEATAEIDRLWPQIPAQRFQENDKAFGMYEGPVYDLLWYAIDNEIHHRGQGYVYLRALGIEPPLFFDRN